MCVGASSGWQMREAFFLKLLGPSSARLPWVSRRGLLGGSVVCVVSGEAMLLFLRFLGGAVVMCMC